MEASGVGGRPIRAAFVFQNQRRRLLADVLDGREPDTGLLGLNHLAPLGVDASVHDPLLTRRSPDGAFLRPLWSARELTLPWELRGMDVVFTPLANLFPLAARARRKLPVVVVNYGLVTIYDRSSSTRRRLLAASLRSATTVICLGESQRRDTVERCDLDPARTRTLVLGADVDWFRADDHDPADEVYVLSVGKDLGRDFATFASAVAALDVRVELVTLPRNVVGAIDLPPNVHVSTAVPPHQLRRLYLGAACVVVPQQPDGYPYGSEGGGLTSICEAMAAGKPIVATERAILQDYLEADELVPAKDPAALREAIARVLGDDRIAAERGERSRTRAEERHSTRRFASALAPVLIDASLH